MYQFFLPIVAKWAPFKSCFGRRLLALTCCLLVTYGVLQLASGWLEMHQLSYKQRNKGFDGHNNGQRLGAPSVATTISPHSPDTNFSRPTSISTQEILLALSDLIEYSNNGAGYQVEGKECQISKIPIWPEGIKYRMWTRPKCGSPDPFRIFNGIAYFDEKSFSCNANIFG